ncbi:DUF6635 family protein [Pacificibacter marinus]|uniref:Uncharacterized protein n=1 Tax=Pacificibacter marinus TaxID=658057 RepID=A0A1Y5TG75_9RHOB|nr:DUF6635 family protein [Pacificibacter marinus]SEL16791.1 hypothetical protein SAMN04488032_11321 [Pacificibacter marinus]SLN62986.1 hypothetical protein PAM7971_03257 [Pacificibacter marinus]
MKRTSPQATKAVHAQAVQDKVDAFVRSHFHFVASLHLHRAALGWDVLRAPINVALAPVFLVFGLAGGFARLIGLSRVSNWLKSQHVFLKTSVGQAIETSIATVLLEDAVLSQRSRALIQQYTSVRAAVAEITTSVFVLLAGLMIFGTATPGVVSLAPKVSGFVAHANAVADFPLGARLGGLWYGFFPVSMSIGFVVMIGVALAMVASIVTTFAGVIADPIQAFLGIHRRRLMRLLDKIAKVEEDASGLAPEHILSRLADLTDAGMSLVRFFRS